MPRNPGMLRLPRALSSSGVGAARQMLIAASLAVCTVAISLAHDTLRKRAAMSEYFFAPQAPASVAVAGSHRGLAVHRIYCVGLNYADHVRELGSDPHSPQVFFMKPADALVENGGAVPSPSVTHDLHHEIELVVALGRGGRDIAPQQALEHVFGYGAGNDLTRRDLQK